MLLLGLATGAQAQTPSLTLDPTQIQAGSLNGATITLTPENASFLGIGAGSGGAGGVGSAYLAGQPSDSERAFTAAGLALIKLSGAPAGLTVSSGKVLAPQDNVHGMTKHRSAEITLTYSGVTIAADVMVTVTLTGSTNDRDSLLRNQARDELSDVSATFTISTAPPPTTLSISGPPDAPEGNSGTRELTYTVSLSQAISGNVSWKVCFTGTATRDTNGGPIDANADYQARVSTNPSPQCTPDQALGVSYSPQTTNSTIKIRVKGDTDPESDETVIATLSIVGSNPGGVTLGTSIHTHTIQDDDTKTLSISAPADANEGDSGTRDLSFPVSLSAPASGLLIYKVCFSGTATLHRTGSISATDDYQAFRGATRFNTFCTDAYISPGDTTPPSSRAVKIWVQGDTVSESDEEVTATLSFVGTPPDDVTLGSPATHTILNDDTAITDTTAPRVTSITRQNPSTSPTNADSLTWRVTFNEAVQNVNNTDFTVSGTTAGLAVTTVSSTIYDVTASGGNLAGLNATVTLGFAGAQDIEDTSGNALTNTTPTGTNHDTYMVDNTVVNFSAATYSGNEGDAISITLQISPARSSTTAVGLTYSHIDTANNDYTQKASVTIPANTASHPFTIATAEDTTVEVDESFVIQINTLPGVIQSTAPDSAVVTIVDDDTTTVVDTTAPQVTSITRRGTSPTDADSLTWRITFDEAVTNVDAADFDITGTGIGNVALTVTKVSGINAYDVKASGGNLAGLNATVTLSFVNGQDIADTSGNALADTAPTGTNNNSYVVDNTDDTAPQVTSISVRSTPSVNNPSLTWRVTFSEPVSGVDPEDFTVSGITPASLTVTPVGSPGTTASLNADSFGNVAFAAGVLILDFVVPSLNAAPAASAIYDVTATFSIGDLMELEDGEEVTLSLKDNSVIEDSSGNPLTNTTPTAGTGTNKDTFVVGDNARVVGLTSDWLVRFGRTVAQQGLDSIAQRLRAPRTAGTRASAGGLDLFGTAGNVRQEHPKPFQDRQDPHAPVSSRSLNDVLPGSHFLRVGETDAHGGSLALWGRAAHTSFDGKEKDLALDGESTAVMLGADYARQDWLGGLILNHSEGEGGYRDPGSTPGDIDASLTTLIPWAALQIREDLQFWGALGVGKGDLELEPDGSDRVDTDIDWSMAAAGIRSDLISPGGNQGLSLTLVGDALWTRTGADRIEGLSVESGEVTRFRLGLEGDYGRVLETGAEVTPRLEVGVRQDGGDAETGAGFEFGGGMSWRDPDVGLKLELAGRTLMAHDSDDLEEEGFSVSLDYDPRPDSARGLSLSVHQEVGARSTGGLDTLFSPEPLTSHDDELENRVRMEAAYGRPVFSGSFIAGPRAGLIHSSTARDYHLGWHLTTPRRSDLSLDIRALYLDHDGNDPEHAAVVEMTVHW